MTLAVIGAGFGRTGTESMKLALEQLGLGPCHHKKEVLPRPDQLAFWRAAMKGERSDWETGLAGFRASIDWPTAFFWRELAAHFPDARILLTVRSAESWYKSFANTILPVAGRGEPDSLGRQILARVFDDRGDEPAHAMAVYERHNAAVRAAIPAERLLTYEVGSGWEPLCAFLDLPVPEAPFPRTNTTREFREHFAEREDDARA